jgi:hypothetical protein
MFSLSSFSVRTSDIEFCSKRLIFTKFGMDIMSPQRNPKSCIPKIGHVKLRCYQITWRKQKKWDDSNGHVLNIRLWRKECSICKKSPLHMRPTRNKKCLPLHVKYKTGVKTPSLVNHHVMKTSMAQDRDKWRTLLNAVLNFRFRKMRGISWLPEDLHVSQKGVCAPRSE